MTSPNASKQAELAALAPARQDAYAFLSAVFSGPPTAERLTAVCGDAFLASAGDLFGEATIALLRDYAHSSGDVTELQQQARQEFMNLFKVPGGQYVSPYESVYRDTRELAGRKVKRLLMGTSAVDVQKWYRLAALEISDEYKDLPDHICLELNYLAHLCAKEQEFAADDDKTRLTRAWEMQRDFLAAHLVSWVKALRDKIHEKSQHAYFRAVAEMAVEFTNRDLATLEDLLGPSNGKSAPDYEEIKS